MSFADSIVVYRNPIEQAMWESGFAEVLAVVVGLILLGSFVRSLVSKR